MAYEYYYEGVELTDLQEAQLEAKAAVTPEVEGASSSTAGVATIIFTNQLTTGQFNRLTTYMRTKAGGATFWRMEII